MFKSKLSGTKFQQRSTVLGNLKIFTRQYTTIYKYFHSQTAKANEYRDKSDTLSIIDYKWDNNDSISNYGMFVADITVHFPSVCVFVVFVFLWGRGEWSPTVILTTLSTQTERK